MLPDNFLVRRHLFDRCVIDVKQEIAVGQQSDVVRRGDERDFPFDFVLGVDDDDVALVLGENFPVGMGGRAGKIVGEDGKTQADEGN